MPSPLRQARNTTRNVTLAQQVRVADNPVTRLVGLLGTPRAKFQPGCGLWIRPCRGIHTLGMGYPIDAIYLDRDMRIIQILHAIAPWRVGPVLWTCRSVLELPAGTAELTGTIVGDQLAIM